jgi:small subunit ribosomal protein S5
MLMQRFKEIKKESKFEDEILEVSRVSRTIKGGRRIGFRVLVGIGDKNGMVGIGVAKASDVMNAVEKAKKKAKKAKINLSLDKNKTIPYMVETSFGAAKIIIRPASMGTGVIAGGVIRKLAELVGIENMLSKILGTRNKISNAKAFIKALKEF